MFVHGTRGWYDRHGERRAEGRFLCLFADEHNNISGIVRFVRMHQCGHFMMGQIKVGSQLITISGTYGADGLPRDLSQVEEANRKFLAEMPAELQRRFWAGGGHNSSGEEGPDVREWAKTIMRPVARLRRW